jgi:hypothetical protein
MKLSVFALVLASMAVRQSASQIQRVELQQATATHSQIDPGGFSISKVIDGLKDESGWAILPKVTDQTAVFETTTDVGFPEGTLLTFTVTCTSLTNQHTIGRFRLSYTTDNRDTFADGAHSDGDVSANWVVADALVFVAANGTTLTELDDHSILASGTSPGTEVYTVVAATSATGISGIKLEVLRHASLPSGGPGRQPDNANFVLTEFEVAAEPLPLMASIYPATQICWQSLPNRTYRVFWVQEIESSAWVMLTNSIAGTGGEVCVFDSTRRSPQGYYRIEMN